MIRAREHFALVLEPGIIVYLLRAIAELRQFLLEVVELGGYLVVIVLSLNIVQDRWKPVQVQLVRLPLIKLFPGWVRV